MKTSPLRILSLTLTASLFFLAPSAPAAPWQTLTGHVPAAVAQLQPAGRLASTNRLHLAVGLAARNLDVLEKLLRDLQDPRSPSCHQYLSLDEFTKRFGPTEQDYQTTIAFAETNGLKVTCRYPNRIILDVEGAVTDVEKALHVTLRTYRHPTENREFFASDTEPALDLAVPLQHIAGLNNYSLPHHVSLRKPVPSTPTGGTANAAVHLEPDAATGPHGYAPADLRNAYVPGTALDGTGQSVGVLEFGEGYFVKDITDYESEFGLPAVTVTNVPIDGGYITQPGAETTETSLDIEMVMAMAPRASIYVFESFAGFVEDTLGSCASHTFIKQFSDSWFGSDAGTNQTLDVLLMELGAQGQSFFAASGDSLAYAGSANPPTWPADDPYVTSVGGTQLTMNGAGASYASETVWDQSGEGSSGGISSVYPIPYWQQGVSMTANHGSTTQRNIPDVAMTAFNLDIRCNNGVETGIGGTSAAAPLWAGFMALVNQQAANSGNPSAGFINPAIYAIGQGTGNTPYASAFHDITAGNNFWSGSPANYSAVAGYDLCTGWGTPALGLISALAAGAPYRLVVLNTNDSGPGSLRQTISNAVAGATITFATNLAGATILLTNGYMTISSNLTIDASALPGGITLNGNHASPIFRIVGSPTPTARLWALTLTNGHNSVAGGAVVNGGVLYLNNCTLAGNSTASGSSGGAIYNSGLLTTLTGCSLSANSADSGGAILNQSSICTVQNCTFAGNTASAGIGGAILSDFGASLNLLHCTFTSNTATSHGGDIYNLSSVLGITNTILAASTPEDVYNASASTNTFGGSNIVQVLLNAGTLVGTNTIMAVNPQLALLGYHGGPTPTQPPLPGSPAIDAAPPSTLGSDTDQRGFPRPLGAAPDIGAVEFQDASSIVTTTADSGIGSLRFASTYTTNGNYITFATNLSGATIQSSRTLILNKDLTIDASALPGGITINGNQAGSVIEIDGEVVLTALTITNGNALNNHLIDAPGMLNGGGIFNNNILTLNQCTVTGNSAKAGGGIEDYGHMVINQSTITGNTASGGGGGIHDDTGILIVNQSTVTGNSSAANSTSSGGIFNSGGFLAVSNSIVAGNTSPDIAGAGIQFYYNPQITTFAGVNFINGNPLLAPLGNYGGPMPTRPPLPGSPAIDGCTNGTTFATDQRGYPRTIGLAPDIGAVEGVYNPAGPGRLRNIARLGNGSVSFSLTNSSDMSFTVLASTNLALPLSQWSNLGTILESPPGSGQYPFIDTHATNYSRRFYGVASP